MNFYERWILPPIIDLIMQQKHLTKYRRAVVAVAHGRVLEIGVGSGLTSRCMVDKLTLPTGSIPHPECWQSRVGVPQHQGYLLSFF
jgi:hypothetical protein